MLSSIPFNWSCVPPSPVFGLSPTSGGGPEPYDYLAINHTGNIMYVIFRESYLSPTVPVLLVSSDQGRLWKVCLYGVNISSIACDYSGEHVIVGGPRVRISHDTGKTWRVLPEFVPHSYCVAAKGKGVFVVAGGNTTQLGGVGVYTSLDYGETWTPHFMPYIASEPYNFSNIAIDATGTNIIAMAYGRVLYTSPDGGNSWVLQPVNASEMWTTSKLYYSGDMSTNGKYMIVVSYSGNFIRSDNYGASWHNVRKYFPVNDPIHPLGRFNLKPYDDGIRTRRVSMDASGKFIITNNLGTNTYNPVLSHLYLSSNYGETVWEEDPNGPVGWSAVLSGNGQIALIGTSHTGGSSYSGLWVGTRSLGKNTTIYQDIDSTTF